MVSRWSCFTDEETEPEWDPNLPTGQPGDKSLPLFHVVLPAGGCRTEHLCFLVHERIKTSGPVHSRVPAAALPPLGAAARLTLNEDVHSVCIPSGSLYLFQVTWRVRLWVPQLRG